MIIVTAVTVPLIICYAIKHMALRIVVTTLSLMIFLGVLSGLTTVKVADLFLAGTT